MTGDTRKPKKSETLEVRLPHETKQAFLSACREDGTTASEVVRESIDGYLGARQRSVNANPARNVITMIPKPIRNWRYAAGAASAAALAAIAVLPSAAQTDFRAIFDRLDANKDGVLSAEEYFTRLGSAGESGSNKTIVIEKRIESPGDAEALPAPGETSEAFTFMLGDGESPDGEAVIQRSEVRIIRNAADGGAPLEIPGAMRKMEFDRFDADKNGQVSFSEFQTRQREMLEAGFRRLDKDKDGSLTEAEYLKINAPVVITLSGADGEVLTENIRPLIDEDKAKANFAKLDKDRNGALSLKEYLPQS
jgi:hypothetical protein